MMGISFAFKPPKPCYLPWNNRYHINFTEDSLIKVTFLDKNYEKLGHLAQIVYSEIARLLENE